MRIVKEDKNLMILKERNVIAYIVGIIFLSAGIAVILKPNIFTNQPPFWSGLVGGFLGVFVIVVTKTTTIKLDKLANKLTFLRRGLIGGSSNKYDLEQIKEVELSIAYNASSRGVGGYSYHLAFVFKSGEIVQLNPGSSSIVRVIGRPIISEKTLGARIAGFLSVPFQERRAPTVSETLSTVSSAIQNAAKKEIKKQKKL